MTLDFKPSPELYPFAPRWFDSNSGRVHYIDEGSGRPILLLHGNPTWSFLYRKIIPELCAAGFRCVAPDYLGFGLSEHPQHFGYSAAEQAEVILSLVRHLDLREFVVMGTDWGGPIALWTATQDPDRVAGLVLGSTWAWPVTGFVKLIAMILRSGFVQRYIVNKNGLIQLMRLTIQHKLTEAELDHYRSVAPTPEFRRGMAEFPKQLLDAGSWLAQLEQDARKALAGKPLLLFRARRDLFGSAAAVIRRFQDLFPEHTVVDLSGAGHFIQEDAPSEVASAIRARFGAANRK